MLNKQDKISYLTVKDYSVSGEVFELIMNSEFGFLETSPQPSLEKLPKYYISEDYISHTDSRRNIFEKVYHIIKKRALRRKLNITNSFTLHDKILLDFGCGTGDFLNSAKKNGWTVFGIEPNKQARQIANDKTNHSVFDSEQLSKLKDKSFDVITLWHVLEHLPKLEDHLSVFKRLLKPNGILIIAVPNFKSYDAKVYKNYWAAFDVPRHLWHFSRTSINKLVSFHNMEVIKTKPLLFDAFYVSLLSEKYKRGRMNPLRAFWVGCLSNFKAFYSKEYSSIIYIVKNINS